MSSEQCALFMAAVPFMNDKVSCVNRADNTVVGDLASSI